MSFGLIGFGFALFQGSLLVAGTSATGEVGARFVDNFKLDSELVDRGAGDSVQSGQTFSSDLKNDSLPGPEQAGRPEVSAVLNRNGNISIKIDDAYPGDVYKLYYAVENSGSAPLMIKLEKYASGDGLSLENTWDGHYTDDIDSLLPGDILSGILVITVGDHSADLPDEVGSREYEVIIELHFKLRGW